MRYFVGSQLEKLNWDNDRGRELPRSCVRLEVVHTVRSHDAEGVLDIARRPGGDHVIWPRIERALPCCLRRLRPCPDLATAWSPPLRRRRW